MGMLLQDYLGNVKEWEEWKNNKNKNKLSDLQNFFFPFFLFGPLLLSNFMTFLFLIHLK
jgi:hypothetical protein